MPDSGFNVSLRDVYDEVRALTDQLNLYLREQGPELAVLKNDVADVKADIKDIREKSEDGRKTRVTLQWQMIGVFVGAVLASIIPLVIK